MKKAHKGTKDFFLGALLGSMIGVAAAALSKNKSKELLDSLTQAGKAFSLNTGENELAKVIDWTSQGIQLWNKVRKQHPTKKGR
jgi:gas vesicle protein